MLADGWSRVENNRDLCRAAVNAAHQAAAHASGKESECMDAIQGAQTVRRLRAAPCRLIATRAFVSVALGDIAGRSLHYIVRAKATARVKPKGIDDER